MFFWTGWNHPEEASERQKVEEEEEKENDLGEETPDWIWPRNLWVAEYLGTFLWQ